jgi:hypothetical protein
MKSIIQGTVFLLTVLFVYVLGSTAVFADASGDPDAVSVAEALHSAGDLSILYDEFNSVMNEYVIEKSPEKKKQLLEKAKAILAKLNKQADSVESEISILSKKKLDKVHAGQLDRVLKNVRQMRASAQKRLAEAVAAG